MRLALVQMSDSNSMESNVEKSIHYIKEASKNKSDLVLFPEVQLTKFFPQYPGQLSRKYQNASFKQRRSDTDSNSKYQV